MNNPVHSERVFVDLGIQHAKRMSHNISSSVTGPAVPYFSSLSQKRHDFRKKKKKKVTEHQIWLFIFFKLSPETFLILRITEQDMIKHAYWSSLKYPLFLSDFKINLDLLDRFSKKKQKTKTQISNFLKTCPMGAELCHADGQTDGKTDRHDQANSRFLQFSERT